MGTFIAFEGIDGCGKQTQLDKAIELSKALRPVFWSSEPNETTAIGKSIKMMLSGARQKPQDPVEFQRLYVIDRAQDIISLIKPRLEDPKAIFLIERFALSTIAYGMLSGKSADFFIHLHNEIIGSHMLWPDLTILIDLPAEEAIRRIAAGRDKSEAFEKLEILRNVRLNYLSLVAHPQFRDKIAVIDGNRPKDEVFKNVKDTILKITH